MASSYYSSYTEPKLVSALTRNISCVKIRPDVSIRVMYLDGLFVKIKIDCSLKYIYLKTENEISKEKKEEIKNNILPVCKDMMEHFFCGTAFLYGIYKDAKLFIYDIYVNQNWLSYYDLYRISEEFNYKDSGFNVLKPLIEKTNFSVIEMFDFLKSEIETKKININRVFILPYYNMSICQSYLFTSDFENNSIDTEGGTEEKIFGVYTAPAIYNNKEESKKKESEKEENKLIVPLSLYEENLAGEEYIKTINCYIVKNNISLTEDEKIMVPRLAKMWGFFTHFNMRTILRNFLVEKSNIIFLNLITQKEKDYTYLFLAFCLKYGKITIEDRKLISRDFLSKILKEEFLIFDIVFTKIAEEAVRIINGKTGSV